MACGSELVRDWRLYPKAPATLFSTTLPLRRVDKANLSIPTASSASDFHASSATSQVPARRFFAIQLPTQRRRIHEQANCVLFRWHVGQPRQSYQRIQVFQIADGERGPDAVL